MSPIEQLSCKLMTGTDSPKTTQSARWQNLPHLIEHRDKVILDDLITNQVQIPLNTVDFSKTTREWRVLQPVMHRVSKLDSLGLPIYSTQSVNNRKRKSWLTGISYLSNSKKCTQQKRKAWLNTTSSITAITKEVIAPIRGTAPQLVRWGGQVQGEGPIWPGPAQVQDPLRPPGQESRPQGARGEGKSNFVFGGEGHITSDPTIGLWANCRFQITSTYQNLAKADLLGGKPDAFVDVSLAPGTHKEMKTKYAKKMFPIFLYSLFSRCLVSCVIKT